jgi:hypothetical protein
VVRYTQASSFDVDDAWRCIPEQDVVELTIRSVHRIGIGRAQSPEAGDTYRLPAAHVEIAHEDDWPAHALDVTRNPSELQSVPPGNE